MFALLFILACPKPPPEPEMPEPDVHVLHGPWEDGGRSLTVAATAPSASDSVLAGPAILVAAWVKDGDLMESTSLNSGGGWTQPTRVAEGVSTGDLGQVRPRVALARGGPVVAFAKDGQPQMARRGAEGWKVSVPSPEAKGELVDLMVFYGQPVIAWLDTRRGEHLADVYAMVDGVEEPVYIDDGDGVCACCRPALGVVDGRVAVAFRDADGAGRELRMAVRGDEGWEDRGPQTHGGWAPGGCPTDGPAWLGETPIVSDARDGTRKLYRGDVVIPGSAGWQITQPRVVNDVVIRLESSPDRNRVVVGNYPLVGDEGTMELGDPAPLGSTILVPWDVGGKTYLAVWQH